MELCGLFAKNNAQDFAALFGIPSFFFFVNSSFDGVVKGTSEFGRTRRENENKVYERSVREPFEGQTRKTVQPRMVQTL